MTKPRTPALLASILLLAFILRALVPIVAIEVGATKESFHDGDTQEYVDGAMGFINEGVYYDKGSPIIKRPPGYSLFLVPGILLGHLEITAIVLQIFLGCFSVFLVWKISVLLFQKKSIALTCSFLFAIEPLSIFYSSKILSETLFVFILLSFILFFVKYLHQRKLSYLVLSSIALAMSVYVRPVSYYLPLLIVVIIFYQAFEEKEKRWMFAKHAVIFFLVFSTLIGVWKVRNYAQTGYSGFSTLAETNLYFYHRVAINTIKEKETSESGQITPVWKKFWRAYKEAKTIKFEKIVPSWEKFLKFYEEKYPNQKDLGGRYEYMKREAFRAITENPVILISICIEGAIWVMRDPGADQYLQLFNPDYQILGIDALFSSVWEKDSNNGFPFIVHVVFRVLVIIFWVLALAGIFQPKVNRTGMIFLVMVVVYLVCISAGVNSYSRFRVPIMPVLCVLGGAGFFILRDKFTGFILRKAS